MKPHRTGFFGTSVRGEGCRRRALLAVSAVWMAFLLGDAQLAMAQGDGDLRGGLVAQTTSGQQVEFPLTQLAVRAHVVGSLAEVSVEQTYENPFDERVEAIYVFPLPEDAAVMEMVMVIGDRRIRADLMERSEARRTYERARDRGQTTSLLEQERPNVFTQSVANIQPGHPIRVLIRFVDQLPYEDGRYGFDFPMVVGPRYVPGIPVGHTGSGVIPDSTQVPDASRLTPPVLPEGVQPGYEVDFVLDLEAGMPIREISSTSHDIEVEWRSDRRVSVTLPPDQRQCDRDVVIHYTLSDRDPEVGLLSHYDERGGFFVLSVQPPVDVDPREVRPKEMVFVIDMSGSMAGHPLDTCKAAIRHAVTHMNPGDTFQIVRFNDDASTFSDHPLSNTPENVAAGLAYLDSLSSMGGTNMTTGIRAALSPPPDGERMRIVLFLTDGYIGNEHEILALIQELIGESRLFALGVGSSVNRFLLDKMSQVGRGSVLYVNVGEDIGQAVETFYGRIHNPVLTDIEVDWEGLEVSAVGPEPIPDLFDGTPLVLTGRYLHPGRGTAVVSGFLGTRPVEYLVDVELTGETGDRGVIPFLWARRRVDQLESAVAYHDDRYYYDDSGQLDDVRDEIVSVALEFGLLTRYTGFVAVQEQIVADVEDPLHTVAIPVALPEGVSQELIGFQVTPDYFQPGDPELVVWAPQDTTAVTAYFPFGLVQSLARDPDEGCWTSRFLVPREVDDGEYQILVAIETAGGQVHYEEIPYRVDSAAPLFTASILPSEVVRVGDVVSFEVHILQPDQTVTGAASGGRQEGFAAQVLPEQIKFVRIYLPDGRAERMLRSEADENLWEFHFRIRERLGTGRFEVLVEAVDVANNTRFGTVWLEVLPADPMALR